MSVVIHKHYKSEWTFQLCTDATKETTCLVFGGKAAIYWYKNE